MEAEDDFWVRVCKIRHNSVCFLQVNEAEIPTKLIYTRNYCTPLKTQYYLLLCCCCVSGLFDLFFFFFPFIVKLSSLDFTKVKEINRRLSDLI